MLANLFLQWGVLPRPKELEITGIASTGDMLSRYRDTTCASLGTRELYGVHKLYGIRGAYRVYGVYRVYGIDQRLSAKGVWFPLINSTGRQFLMPLQSNIFRLLVNFQRQEIVWVFPHSSLSPAILKVQLTSHKAAQESYSRHPISALTEKSPHNLLLGK